ncbi:putative BAG-associated GRAM protein 1 [Cocos nucifera]|uniref:Putative BAG-associated GRAM protein 1 n=1 Tax=Cocos nucifera TaxID=13894 RepID=A0A8K0N8S3_COCNU|nr:putative BAG-associated GRAM protein 1 [Cocos nucifera]
MASMSIGFFFPSWWEIEVTVAVALFVIAVYTFFERFFSSGPGIEVDRLSGGDEPLTAKERLLDDREKMSQFNGHSRGMSAYLIKLELLAAKNLIGANLNGTSDPYAIITCGEQKRFSSMVPGSRNPMWGEEFNFIVDVLPVQIEMDEPRNPSRPFEFLVQARVHDMDDGVE